MQTPQKRKPSKRFITTTATQKHDTIFKTLEDEKRSRMKTQVFGDYSSIAKKIHFVSQQQQLCIKMGRDQKKIEETYRRKMINYLNTKFGDAIANINKEPQRKTKIIQTKGKQKLQERIENIFKQFMYNVRQLKCSYLLSEYEIGNLLKQMSFLQKLLDQRHIILRICSQLSHLTVASLFMFILHFYTIRLQENKELIKKTVIQLVQFLFQQEGFRQSLINLEKYFENGERVSKKEQFNFMRFNRQKRPTSSSISRSLNRKK